MDLKGRNSTNINGQVSRGVVDLPQEIISDILCRLPIESILTCRVVCKALYATTQDPCFANKLGNSSYQHTRIILKPQPGENSDSSCHLVLLDIEEHKTRQIPIDKMLANLQIMSSCNGLLCMASAKNLNPVVIYNPLTRERVILPSTDPESAIIACHEVGLGFDPSTNNYKVVRAYIVVFCRFSSRYRRVRRFEIISLGESLWRKLSPPQSIADWDGCGVEYWNGFLYWTLTKGNFINFVQFDLSVEKFRVYSFPDYFSSDHASLGMIDVGGCLTLVQNEDGIIELWSLAGIEVGGDLSICLKDAFDTHVKWGGGLRCRFLCQLNQDSYLLQVGFWDSQCQSRDCLTQYFPEKIQYSNLEMPGLPNSFKAICFKPSLINPLAASFVPGDF